MSMRVKMITNIAGTPNYKSGDVVDLEDRIATAWIKEGYAVPDREEKSEKAAK